MLVQLAFYGYVMILYQAKGEIDLFKSCTLFIQPIHKLGVYAIQSLVQTSKSGRMLWFRSSPKLSREYQ